MPGFAAGGNTLAVAMTVVFPLTIALFAGAVMHTVTVYAPDSGVVDWQSVPSASTGWWNGTNMKLLNATNVMSTLKEKPLPGLKKSMNAPKITPSETMNTASEND